MRLPRVPLGVARSVAKERGSFLVEVSGFVAYEAAFIAERRPFDAHERTLVAHAGPFIADDGPSVADERRLMADVRTFMTQERAFVGDDHGFVAHEACFVAHERGFLLDEGGFLVDEPPFVAHEAAFMTDERRLRKKKHPAVHFFSPKRHPIQRWFFERQEGGALVLRRAADRTGEIAMNTNRPTQQARDAQVITGVKKNLQNAPSLALSGTTFTPDALVKLVQSRIDAANAIAAAKANFHTEVVAFRVLSAQVTKVLRGLRQLVINTFGEDSTILADFGFTPPKKATLTPEQLVARAKKAAATRALRGTKGPKAKLAVKAGVTTTPAETPAQPTPPAAPIPPKP
jgi:hypothetical protein